MKYLTNKGYRCVIINGGQDIDQRKIALSKFKNEAQILIGTDAAGESLNMQFCHIIFNYDLPWNPMMIEQRIGRVDRIGQKNKVIAYNMLPNNSVDARVYEIIVTKLNNILEQLGIDKTSDVLDSTLDIKKVNGLYLQSLLDPSKFEFAGDKWLIEIKSKLKEYQSTEGVLPEVKENEIDPKKAAEVKHSPLPSWLEDITLEYMQIHNKVIKKSLLGYYEADIDNTRNRITFDSEVSLNDPTIEHITLQHSWIKKILSDLNEFDPMLGLPVIRSKNGEETTGIWSLWQLSAQNNYEQKLTYQSFFIADNGKLYTAYANDIWNRIVAGNRDFELKDGRNFINHIDEKDILKEVLFTIYQNLESNLNDLVKYKRENKLKSYNFQKMRIEKIGIKNIRISKLRRLETEHEKWLRDDDMNKKVIPGIKHLLSVRIDG